MSLAGPMSILVVALALSVSVATAYPTKDDEGFYYNRLHDLPDYKQDTRNLDGLGGGNLLRDLDMLRNRAAFFSRSSRSDDGRRYQYFDSLLGTTLGGHKRTAGCCLDSLGYGGGDFSGSTLGSEKRNMDEIDRSGFNSFVKKNFDEIDRSGFGSFVKRNFDEIDRSGFGSFVKRNSAAPVAPAPDQPHN